jgi:hypothetical protein
VNFQVGQRYFHYADLGCQMLTFADMGMGAFFCDAPFDSRTSTCRIALQI